MRAAAILAVVLLHFIALTIVLSSASRFAVPEMVDPITWLNLTDRTREEQKLPDERKGDERSATEPLWSLPAVPAPIPDDKLRPDFQGLGRMLNNCRIEVFSYLSDLEQRRCAAVMVQMPRRPAGSPAAPYRAEEEARWERERAEIRKPKTLPCFGEDGFSPLSPGCLLDEGSE